MSTEYSDTIEKLQVEMHDNKKLRQEIRVCHEQTAMLKGMLDKAMEELTTLKDSQKQREREAARQMWVALSTEWTDLVDVWKKTEEEALQLWDKAREGKI